MIATPVRAERLFRYFRGAGEEVLALRGVSLSLAAGEWLTLTGPPGSGKSTLLACIAGLDEPDGGNVWIAGRRINRRTESDRALLRARLVGMLYRSGNLLGHLTLAQNIRFARDLARQRRDGDDVAGRLAAVGLDGHADASPGELSAGQAARAALAVALANDPPVLIADEPTGELDEVTERAMLGLLAARAAAGMAVLVASGSRAVVRAAHRVLRLRDGRLDGSGP